ncbi:hypothetical protein PENTCL1PPCAC_13802, partial [Pristionchus entomophagus]
IFHASFHPHSKPIIALILLICRDMSNEDENPIPLPPIYELLLEEGEFPTSSAQVINGTSLEIRCTVSSNETAEKTINVVHNGQFIDASRSSMSATLKIESFNSENDGGMYECNTVLGGNTRTRKIKLMQKVILPPDAVPCTGPDFCRNGGVCALTDDKMHSYCNCPKNYVGPSCENVLVSDYVGKSILTQTKVGVAAGGTCNLVFIFLFVVFGLLFFRERKRRRRVEGMMNKLNHHYHFESLPLVKEHLYTENPYSHESPPERRSDTVITSSGKTIFRTNAVMKKIIAPGEEDESAQPHAS